MKKSKIIKKYLLQAIGIILFLDFIIALMIDRPWTAEYYRNETFIELIDSFFSETYVMVLWTSCLHSTILSGVLGFAFYKMDKALEEFEIINLRIKKTKLYLFIFKTLLAIFIFYSGAYLTRFPKSIVRKLTGNPASFWITLLFLSLVSILITFSFNYLFYKSLEFLKKRKLSKASNMA